MMMVSSSFAASLTNRNLTSANSGWQNVRSLQKVIESMRHASSWLPMWIGRQTVKGETRLPMWIGRQTVKNETKNGGSEWLGYPYCINCTRALSVL
jgi:hypothetical protein